VSDRFREGRDSPIRRTELRLRGEGSSRSEHALLSGAQDRARRLVYACAHTHDTDWRGEVSRRSLADEKGVAGELVRTNVTDNEPGVPLYADFQVIDVDTCEPVEGVYLEFWHGEYLPCCRVGLEALSSRLICPRHLRRYGDPCI
jgi:hypothetical protein